jgi:plastocyanin
MSIPWALRSIFVFAYIHLISAMSAQGAGAPAISSATTSTIASTATSSSSTTMRNIPPVQTSFLAAAVASVPVTPSPSTSSTSSSTTSAPQTYTIKVGAGGFAFEPQQLNASIGDTVEFEFYPSGHSVAQAAFDSARIPYEQSGKGRVGFWSGTREVTGAAVRTRHLPYNTKANCFAAKLFQNRNQQYWTCVLLLCGARALC